MLAFPPVTGAKSKKKNPEVIMKSLFVVAVLILFMGNSGFADVERSDMARIIDFYAKNVGGTVLKMSKPSKAKVSQGDETFLIEYSRAVKFSKMKLTKTGFTFDLTSDIVNKSTRLNSKGKPTKEVNTHVRHLVHRYSIAERKSSSVNNVLGFIHIPKDSEDDSTGVAYTVAAKMVDGALVFEDTLLMYADESLDGGETIFPGATTSDMTLSVEDGKLKMDQAYTLYEVDPETFHPTPLTDENGKPMKPAHVIAVEK